ncbi:hypothetical protein Q2T83_06570 [Fervidibacter sacchari]|uniref:Uncharacterized protein n=1 Tax=Candidatus Fervidibacter sacchari TaxID=1448929 RepID=A0ABT2ELF3_9BACT|nr:hypothetical protein [Candidatus Fervidibacter sacchari]MCS3918773.1 hypothetical protein [Candidatus Fervidibacter sacchari]WKU17480.1 hypothetical protein Q2T83_06570 [Candidatus Fervidibacter sacchari]
MSEEVTISSLSLPNSLSEKGELITIGALWALSFMTGGMLSNGMIMGQEGSLDTLTNKEGGFLTMGIEQLIIGLLIGMRAREDMFR